ncbi:hypothetical protein [Pseudogemmobacter sonorensis]|uniref:hypothetical protein n=1 Tax=Pseudogemmobacter sonorensis TaxID=2989681 RepID=UPI0036A9385E
MTGILSKLPQPVDLPKKAGGIWAKVRAKPVKKIILPVVEVKKAMKLMKGAGKSLAAIELMPEGGFRVIAAGTAAAPAPEPPSNPWDDILDE